MKKHYSGYFEIARELYVFGSDDTEGRYQRFRNLQRLRENSEEAKQIGKCIESAIRTLSDREQLAVRTRYLGEKISPLRVVANLIPSKNRLKTEVSPATASNLIREAIGKLAEPVNSCFE